MSDESIVAVAIMLNDREAFVSPVAGKGRHGDLIRTMAGAGLPTPIAGEQGFVTSKNRFVDRVEGLAIALAAQQVTNKTPGELLFSEDLW